MSDDQQVDQVDHGLSEELIAILKDFFGDEFTGDFADPNKNTVTSMTFPNPLLWVLESRAAQEETSKVAIVRRALYREFGMQPMKMRRRGRDRGKGKDQKVAP